MAKRSVTIEFNDCGNPGCPGCNAKAHQALAKFLYGENPDPAPIPKRVHLVLDTLSAATYMALSGKCSLGDLLEHVKIHYGRAETSLNIAKIFSKKESRK